MSPERIVKKAAERKLDIIGICDHNSAENVKATMNAAHKRNLVMLPGMEIASVEEVHVIALFDDVDSVLKLQETVYENLNLGENNPELFGEQIIVNEFDEVEGHNRRLLIGSTTLTLQSLLNEIHKSGGLAIASHVDRESFSIIGQLGFIPENLDIDALEISPNITISEAKDKFSDIFKLPLMTGSDAHFLEDIGKATTLFVLKEPTVSEIRMALRKKEGRRVYHESQ